MNDELQVETSGETVGEAKWQALRELERLRPGLDKAAVRFQVLSEGERGLLGVGYTPARVLAFVEDGEPVPGDRSEAAAAAHEVVERIAAGLGVDCRVTVAEDDEAVTVSCAGPELGILIGKHGQTIDAIQHLVNAAVFNAGTGERKPVVVDAAGYRARREAGLAALAVRTARQVVASGEPAELEPMSSVERKIVHVRLKDFRGVETTSAGSEPNRRVIVSPSAH